MKAADCLLSRKRVKRAVEVNRTDQKKKKKKTLILFLKHKSTHLSASLDRIAVQILTAQSNHQVSI